MLQGLFLQAYTESWGSELNIEQMYSSDLLFWIINILDMARTGDHNGNNASIRNQGKKIDRSKLKDFKISNGDTFARQQGIIPLRWSKVLGNRERIEQKDNRFDLFEQRLRSYRKK